MKRQLRRKKRNATIAAAAMFAACAEGRLKLAVRPTSVMHSGIGTNGRGRATACLMELMMSGSPSATASRMNATQSAPLVRCFQMSTADAAMTIGTKSLFPLRMGMSQSKSELLIDWLTRRNSAASAVWSQAVK